jgi:hypothetical protein
MDEPGAPDAPVVADAAAPANAAAARQTADELGDLARETTWWSANIAANYARRLAEDPSLRDDGALLAAVMATVNVHSERHAAHKEAAALAKAMQEAEDKAAAAVVAAAAGDPVVEEEGAGH